MEMIPKTDTYAVICDSTGKDAGAFIRIAMTADNGESYNCLAKLRLGTQMVESVFSDHLSTEEIVYKLANMIDRRELKNEFLDDLHHDITIRSGEWYWVFDDVFVKEVGGSLHFVNQTDRSCLTP